MYACDLPANAPRSLGLCGKRHVNSAGQEFREFLQIEKTRIGDGVLPHAGEQL